MSFRLSEEGVLMASHAESITVPNITDGDTADVTCVADANFIADDPCLLAMFAGPPIANLGIVGAWVSTESTGVITIRFSALTGNVTGAAQKVVVQRFPNT